MSLGSVLKSITWYYYIWDNFTREISQEKSDPYFSVFSFAIAYKVIHLEISIVTSSLASCKYLCCVSNLPYNFTTLPIITVNIGGFFYGWLRNEHVYICVNEMTSVWSLCPLFWPHWRRNVIIVLLAFSIVHKTTWFLSQRTLGMEHLRHAMGVATSADCHWRLRGFEVIVSIGFLALLKKRNHDSFLKSHSVTGHMAKHIYKSTL